jgi:zinc protease
MPRNFWMLPVLGFLSVAIVHGTDSSDVTRATLDNGLRVVIVRDTLAPVVTLETNYLVGGSDTPAGFPGTAHAQEHMTFRGCLGVTADQIAAIYAQLGGQSNAETRQTTTRYFVTLPAQDLDVALRVDAACMAGVEDAQKDWDQERGAIEQEVSRDLSYPTYKLIVRVNQNLFAGTVYEHDPLGSKESFDKTTAADLKQFWDKWYAPNNAILIITGNIDPAATIEKVKQYYGKIPRREIAAHPKPTLQPVKQDTFTLDSNLPYTLTSMAYRFPGTNSADYPAATVLADVLSSQRADLYGLVPQGKALYAGFQMFETHPEASAAFVLGALPPNGDTKALNDEMLKIVNNYAQNGVPADLVEASKRSWVAGAEFSRNSIPNLGDLWSEALAEEGRQSPDDDIEAIKRVTVDDVNRVAKKYLLGQAHVVGILKPSPSGEAVASKGFGGSEQTTSAPTKPVTLPDWAEAAVKSLHLPEPGVRATDMTLSNGIRLIVQTEKTSPTITLTGSIKMQTEMQTPVGKDGVGDVLEGLFSYGTKTLDRLAFQKALDDIAAGESAGGNFSLKVLKQHFARGVELLADNELHPALPEDAFKVVQQQTAEATAGELESPGYRMQRALIKALLPSNDPLQRETTPKSISALKYDDILQYFASAYRPDLTTIVVIGDITPAEARSIIEKYFDGWKMNGPKPNVVLPPVPKNKPSALHVPDPTQVQASVTLTEQLDMNRFSPDFYALQVGDHVLGGGFYATRLYRDIREKAGYVYSIQNSFSADETRADYTIEYGCDAQNVSKARTLVEQELRSMQKDAVSAAELQQAKALLLRQIQLREASEDSIAAGIISRARIGLSLNEPYNASKHYFEMTADEVRAAFTKWIDPSNFVQAVRGPEPK